MSGEDEARAEERAGLAHPLRADSRHAAAALAAGRAVRFYMVDVTGLPSGHVAKLLPIAARDVAERGLVPVFLTDAVDLKVFRHHDVIFEVLPPLAASARLDPGLDWAARREECRALAFGKWRPEGEVRLGGSTE